MVLLEIKPRLKIHPLGEETHLSLFGLHSQKNLNNKYLYLTALEAGKSKFKVPENSVSGEDPFSSSVMPSSCVLTQ